MFKGCHLANDLLVHHGRSVDLCVISALHRHCMVLPEASYPCQVRTWPWSDEQVNRWVVQHEGAADEGLARARSRVTEVARVPLGKRTRRVVESSTAIVAVVGSTRVEPDLSSTRVEPVAASGGRVRKRLRPLAEVAPSCYSTETPAYYSIDGVPGSLLSKWSEPP